MNGRSLGLQGSLTLSILKEMVPGGLRHGASYVVEFEPDSPWFETSLTIVANALRQGMKSEYHSFMHEPSEIRAALLRLGLDVKKLEQDDLLRILDTYDIMTGLAAPETSEGMKAKGRVPYEIHHHAFNLSDWSSRVVRFIKEGVDEDEKRWLHVDDNTSVLNHYCEEKLIVDTWRTRFIPYARVRELAMVHSLMSGVGSSSFYKQFESLCDGILDLKSREEGGRFEHFARVRMIRGVESDTRWRRLRLLDNGEVNVDSTPVKMTTMGIGGWLRGPRK